MALQSGRKQASPCTIRASPCRTKVTDALNKPKARYYWGFIFAGAVAMQFDWPAKLSATSQYRQKPKLDFIQVGNLTCSAILLASSWIFIGQTDREMISAFIICLHAAELVNNCI